MMILSCILDLKTTQADITAAIVNAHLNQKDEVYVNQPRGFWAPGTTNRSHVLKLKRALYGLEQSPRCFFQHLSKHLVMHGLKQSSFDPCLFIGHDVIVIVYVDDIHYAKTNEPIDALITKLQSNFQIHKEDSAAGFLGVDIKSTGGCLTLTQSGLIERIITALGLRANYSKDKDTPAEAAPLPKDPGGIPADPTFPYASIIGMLLYLAGPSRPDIAFAVNQCARYTFQPTRKHVVALKRSMDAISRKRATKDLSYILPSLFRLIAFQILTLLGYIITSILKIHIVYAVALVMLFFLPAALSYGKASFKQK
jgi:hypothetical protein